MHHLNELLHSAITEGSRKTYQRAWTTYVDFISEFCESHTSLLSVSVNNLASKFVSSTISTYVTALSYVHKLANFSDPTKHFLVQKILAAHSKLYSTPDVSYCVTAATIVITDYKHNSSRRPFSVVLDRATGPEFCPVHYLQRYCSMRGLTPGALYSFSDGSPVKTSHFTQQLRQALNFCGLDSSQYKAHSFRIGAASSAADNGLSDAQIRHPGRWKSDAFKLYIRQPPERFKI